VLSILIARAYAVRLVPEGPVHDASVRLKAVAAEAVYGVENIAGLEQSGVALFLLVSVAPVA
jgi:hypothetical protein